VISYQLPITSYQLPVTNYQLPSALLPGLAMNFKPPTAEERLKAIGIPAQAGLPAVPSFGGRLSFIGYSGQAGMEFRVWAGLTWRASRPRKT